KMVVQETQREAQPLTAVDLAAQIPKENAHIALSGFTFGKPVIEKGENESWKYIWLPLEPTAKPKKAPPYSLFYQARAQDQTALNELLTHKQLTVLVTNGLPDGSRAHLKPDESLRKAYSKIETSKMMLLAPAEIKVGTKTLPLSDARLYDPNLE